MTNGPEHEPLDLPLSAQAEAEIAAAAAPERVRLGTRERLLARATADRASRSGPGAVRPTPTPARRSVGLRAFVGVSTLLAASLVLLVRVRAQRDEYREAYAAADKASVQRVDSLRTLLAERDQMVASLTGADVRVVGLSSSATTQPRALMFWDKATDRWTFVAHNLPKLAAGRTYQLWLVTADRKISAGTFAVSATGDVVLQATYALNRDALKAVAVTEEPSGGVPQPTGAMVVVGTAATQ
jgi:hypothetical protein